MWQVCKGFQVKLKRLKSMCAHCLLAFGSLMSVHRPRSRKVPRLEVSAGSSTEKSLFCDLRELPFTPSCPGIASVFLCINVKGNFLLLLWGISILCCTLSSVYSYRPEFGIALFGWCIWLLSGTYDWEVMDGLGLYFQLIILHQDCVMW